MQAQRGDGGGRPRHRRRARRHDVDVRFQRGVRAHQRGVPDMRPSLAEAQTESFPVAAADRTHVPVDAKDFLSVLDLTHDELERVLDLAAELKRDRATSRAQVRSRWPAGTSRCCSRSRRCARARRSPSRFANSAAKSSNRRPTSHSAAARPSRTSRAISSAGSTAPSSARSRRSGSHSFAKAAPRTARRQRAHRTRSIRARRWPTC